MRAPAVSFAHKIAAATLAASLTFTLVPFAHADGEGSNAIEDEAVASGLPDQPNDSIEPSLGEPQEVSAEQDTEGSPVAPMLASGLVGKPSAFINSDVALDSEPVVGSFTVDGLTFAVAEGSTAELVGVSEKARTSARPPVDSEAEADAGTLVLSESVSYGGADYILASIAPYAFYLSGVASVTLPASVNDVDDRAFRSSDVASVTVAEGNPTYSSSDGALYDADQLSLLLIPEGKQGAVLLPKTAEVAEASVFSHCPLVDSISVEKDGAAFASENGLLYDASLTTLLRVPAGATDITIRDGCTTIAAGALEACAKLTTINAPATVSSISPDVFHAIPIASLPAASAILGEWAEAASPSVTLSGGVEGGEVEGSNDGQVSEASTQLTAMVALSSTDGELPTIDPTAVTVLLPIGAVAMPWQSFGFTASIDVATEDMDPSLPADIQSASTYSATTGTGIPLATVFYDPGFQNVTTRRVYSRQYDASGAFKDTLQSTTTFTGTRSADAWLVWISGSSVLVFLTEETVNGGFKQIYESWTPASSYGEKVTGWKYQGKTVSNACEVNKLGNGTLEPVWSPHSCTYTPGSHVASTKVTTGWRDTTTNKDTNTGSSTVTGNKAYSGTDLWYGSGSGIRLFQGRTGTRLNYSDFAPTPKTGYSVTGWWRGSTSNKVPSNQSYWFTSDAAFGPIVTANSYTVEYWNKAGTTKLSSDTGFKYDTARNLAAKPSSGVSTGYSAVGWSTSTNQSTASYGFGSSQKNLATSGTKKLYLAETANRYTVSFNVNGGSGGQSSNVTATYAANMPGISTTKPTRAGYTFGGWYDTSSSSGGTQYYNANCGSARTWNKASNATLYARWTPNSYTVEYWNKAGTTKLSSDTGFKYDTARNLAAKPSSGVSTGYSAVGWSTSTNQSTASYGFGSSQKNLATSGTKKLYLAETANSYTVEYWNKAGTTKLSSDANFKYDTARALAAKPAIGVNAGYTAIGWSTSTNQSTATYGFGSSQKNLVASGTKKLYLAETANKITLAWNSQGGSTVASTSATYSPTAKVPMPATTTKAGYTFAGWWTAASGGTQVTSSTALPTSNKTYYAHWSLNPYAITYDLAGGAVSGNPTTYDVTTTTFTLKNPTRTGYAFAGWSGTGLTGSANKTVTIAQGSTGDRAYTAHWLPAISADLPIEVEARVDVLGLEEQEEATGYIESRCGEPLTVADVAFEPLPGASELFGSANVADVALEVLAAGSTSPDARFTLDASASQAPVSSAAFCMASYGMQVPISYRFAMPDTLLPSLAEATKPVCSVAYTVVLA